jgi:predicted DCC family thiol-disulfide oxidoreductase YuxK
VDEVGCSGKIASPVHHHKGVLHFVVELLTATAPGVIGVLPTLSAEVRTPWKVRRPNGDVLLVIGDFGPWHVEASVGRSPPPQAAAILLYDGVCGFCNHVVQTIIRFDRRGTLRFAALDSDVAQGIIERHPSARGVDSMVFVDNLGQPAERVNVRSAAGLRVAQYLGGPWRLLLGARAIPVRQRDWAYDRFASFRYRVFGKYETCPVPPEGIRARFIDN